MVMTPPLQGVSIIEAAETVWAPWFKNPETWAAWRVFLAVIFGLPLSEQDRALYQERTGRVNPPAGPFNEAWLICGRRAGKSFTLALIAVYLALSRDWGKHLSPGELGAIKVIANDRKQARTIFRYARALLIEVPEFKDLVLSSTDDTLELSGNVVIEVQTANFRSVRGYTVIACLADEIAFWRSDESSANPDSEIIAAVKPSMATVPGSMFLAASSPYARRGELWNAFRRHWGQDTDTLIWRATTREMNPTVPQSFIDAETEKDPQHAAAEYMAEFRTDVEVFITLESLLQVTAPDRIELPYVAGNVYIAFTDPGGGRSDSFTLAVAHKSRAGTVVLDLVREVKAPYSPEQVVKSFSKIIKQYHVTRVHGDKYSAEWVVDAFRQQSLTYEQSERVKSELYLEFLPLVNSGQLELLDNPRAQTQFVQLERRTARGGRDSVDHMKGTHDDLCNAIAGACVVAYAGGRGGVTGEALQQVRDTAHGIHRSGQALGMQRLLALPPDATPWQKMCADSSAEVVFGTPEPKATARLDCAKALILARAMRRR